MMRQLGSVLVICLAITPLALASPYNTPTLDAHVTTDPGDWLPDEWSVDDPPDDCRWGATDADLDDLCVTWDENTLFVGITAVNRPSGYGNGYILYIDTDAQNGITGATDFSMADYWPRHVVFSTMGIDAFMGLWNLIMGTGGVRHCTDPFNTYPLEGATVTVDPGTKHIEFGIPWDGLYGLGEGQVPPLTTLRFVSAIVGGDDSGAYDAMPTTSTGVESDPSTPWNATIDLDTYYEATVDANGDGLPDHSASPAEVSSWGRLKEAFAH